MTSSTSNSAWLQAKIKSVPDSDTEVLACPGLAEAIESGDTKLSKNITSQILTPYSKNKISAIGLGCTHYSQIKDYIADLFLQTAIVDPTDAVAQRVLSICGLMDEGLEKSRTQVCFYSTATDTNILRIQIRNLLSIETSVESVQL